jgi:muramoyltetrapeptide carboxypeptidase
LTRTTQPIIAPLRPGATIGVIAPAGHSPAAKIDAITPWLAARGYTARIYPACRSQLTYLAGPDADRLADLHAAFADREVDAIVCMRGGYGSARLLDGIDFDLVRANRKLFVGYSDITSLHIAFTQQAGMVTVHGPMLTSDLIADDDGRSTAALLDLFTRGMHRGDVLPAGGAPIATLTPGKARGTLTGGNLAVVCASLGTPWEIDLRGAVLFIEDIAEEPYRVDRLLTQLRLAGKLEHAAGFVIGSFSDAADPGELIAGMLAPFGKPTIAGWPAGHCSPNYPLPFGADVVLDADAGTLTLA